MENKKLKEAWDKEKSYAAAFFFYFRKVVTYVMQICKIYGSLKMSYFASENDLLCMPLHRHANNFVCFANY